MTATAVPLRVRGATLDDLPALAELQGRCAAGIPTLSPQMLRGQLNHFADGQLVVERGGRILGHAATFLIAGAIGLGPHTWAEITGGGFAARHDQAGEWLYVLALLAGPDDRDAVGEQLVGALSRLALRLNLSGVLIAAGEGSSNSLSPARLAMEGYEAAHPLVGYLGEVGRQDGPPQLLVWRNEEQASDRQQLMPRQQGPRKVRVAAVQFQLKGIRGRDEFREQVAYFVKTAAEYRADFVALPELYTMQLLSLEREPLPPAAAMQRIAEYTDWFVGFMQELAVRHRINVVGGTHLTRHESGEMRNVAYVMLRDGRLHTQDKIHPTPSEAAVWKIKGGHAVTAIDTDCGPIGVLVCYDAEFPELPRYLADQGAKLLFVPFCTDDRRGFLRVRYSCHARAIENQIYVAMAGVCGNLPNVENMDVHYAESAILTPCDIPFARDGIAADTAANVEMIAVADLDLGDLETARREGSVRNFLDRRFDLYQTRWTPSSRR